MISAREMAVVDENAAALGVPRKQLMESSGNAVARTVRNLVDPGASLAVVCGRGNNGGDAMVAARFLDEYDQTIHLLGRPETISTEISRENWHALQRSEYDTRVVTDSTALDLDDPDLVVDAMLGTGVTGSLREPEATAARVMNEADAPVLSVDVPSGMDVDTGDAPGTAVEADHVVTFYDAKPGLEDLAATVRIERIGIPAAAAEFVERGDLLRLSRDADAHKGDFGEVLVVGGGPYTGAPALAGRAAFRAGADLVRIACPESVADEIQGYSESYILRPYDPDRFAPPVVDDVLQLADEHDCVVLGPGLGDAGETLEAVAECLRSYDGRAVVDADALQVVPEVETDATLVCTPHQGELAAMGGGTSDDWRERRDLVESFAADLGQTVLAKGKYDVISDGDRTRVNRTGNPGMTVGGTGDVLAGATAALACTLDPHPAASLGAYANGRAGDLVVEDQGYGLTARQLADELPHALWSDR
jgi:NAD(P)H-hydrate epimerase